VDIAINIFLAKYELSFKVLFNDIHSLLNDIVQKRTTTLDMYK